jgi:hypothetical protein
MRLRHFQPSDQERIAEIFAAQGFSYDLPELPKFPHLQILADEHDQTRIVVACRNLAEVFMLVDPQWENPGVRMNGLAIIHESMRRELAANNIPEVIAWLPPQIDKAFGSRLIRSFGWYRPLWPVVALKIEEDRAVGKVG